MEAFVETLLELKTHKHLETRLNSQPLIDVIVSSLHQSSRANLNFVIADQLRIRNQILSAQPFLASFDSQQKLIFQQRTNPMA